MQNNICLICLRPRKVWLDFFAGFKDYSVFFMIDDNSVNYADLYKNEYPSLKFIQVYNKSPNFIDKDFPNEILTGWHKALYYFSNENLDYYNTWFMEDDVFFYDENTLKNIDIKYPNSDCLTNTATAYDAREPAWHWYKITMNYDLPWYNAMVCATRLSRTMLSKIKEYADTHGTLFFIEAMFPTLTIKNNLIHDSPSELENIYYRDEIDLTSLSPYKLYHPMKNLDIYNELREQISRSLP